MLQDEIATPMMQQYLEVKNKHQDCLVLFRMGDFYELFFDDALKAAPILEVVLTKRGKADSQDIPMCGVPHHSAESYIKKLINSGLKVAICDQLETPQEAKKRGGYKAIVKRDVIRIITPGTITEENFLEAKSFNYLMSIAKEKNCFSISYAEISTLQFNTLDCNPSELENQIARICPSEIIISDSLLTDPDIKNIYQLNRKRIVTFADSHFKLKKNYARLLSNFEVRTLESFGKFSDGMIISSGVILEYISITQKKEKVSITPPSIESSNQYMQIDQAALNNLEIFYPSNKNGNSLIRTLDKTKTSVGARLLYKYLASPLLDIQELNRRYDVIDLLINNQKLNDFITTKLKNFPDLERTSAKLAYDRGQPSDLFKIMIALDIAKEICQFIQTANIELIEPYISGLKASEEILDILKNCLLEKGVHFNNEDFISPEYSSELKQLYDLRDHGHELINQLRDQYRNQTEISNLKIEFNNVLGFYIEVTKSNLHKINDDKFVHKQTMINCTRYYTQELKTIEKKLITAKEEIALIESKIFQELVVKIKENIQHLNKTSQTIAQIDVFTSFANLSVKNNFSRPILENNTKFDIHEGRHPMVEEVHITKSESPFIPNDCLLEKKQKLWLLTGPNMAGKSTFLRQNALIAIIAQAGFFVPAKKATIGIVDKVFSRVGAGDDLVQGRSTFLVEMIETATILNQATEKSLVILDEVGRGTSTYDGLAIAWSCLEYLHNKIGCRTLFATHYHELVKLKFELENLECYTAQVKEWDKKVIFMHKIIKGVADKSYGINVAELAGIPKSVTERAKFILDVLHANKPENKSRPVCDDLFSYHQKQEDIAYDQLIQTIDDINPDNLTPKDALDFIYNLKTQLKN